MENFELESLKIQIQQCGLWLHQRNLIASGDGNISHRFENSKVVITPTGKNKLFLKSEEMALINLSNKVLSGIPSSEREMHLAIYNSTPTAQCVVHAHPPHAIALSLAFPEWKELPNDTMSELILAVGSVPIVPYARPGTQSMGNSLIPFLPQNRVMILARHGAVSWGENLEEAYNGMERLEHASQILCNALKWGPIQKLPPEEIQYLKDIRKKLGDQTR